MNGILTAVECVRYDARGAGRWTEVFGEGTTSFPEVGPEVVLSCKLSGDVNQGRDMQVLARELNALDAAMIAFEGVGKRVRAGHPERVRRVLQPLSVEGSEFGGVEVLRGAQVSLVRGSGSGFGEPLPFGEKPLQDLDVRRLQTCRKVLPSSVLVHQSGLPE
jgi:hypothetical protein